LVTFLLTDIEGSTRLFRRIGDRYPPLLDLHREILGSAWDDFDGVEFKTEGDACLVAFGDAASAIEAAVEAQRQLSSQRWPPDAAIRVRMGVHTGVAYPRGDDYVAFAVHQAARVVSVGHGGQVVVSADTAQHALSSASFTLRSLGHYRVRDFEEPVELFQPVGVGLDELFPPLRALPADQHNLVAPITSLVGRAEELAELAELVVANRLVSVVGPGGLGKTRLVVEYGLAHSGDWSEGIWFVDLSRVTEPSAVSQAVMEAVRSVADEADLWVAVLDHLRNRQMVLVLDNCEHLLSEVAGRVVSVLRSCPQVRVLATSREPLGLRGERIWRPSALPVETAAADLFSDRAGFTDCDDAARTEVVELCRRLDGLPLAIELAAARADVVPLGEMRERLNSTTAVLYSRDPTLDPRQRSLDDVIGWSYQLLDPAEQSAFRRLALFPAGFDLTAASAAMDDATVSVDEVPEQVWSLLAKSLLVSETAAGSTRYRMLETVRSYARRQLEQNDETQEVAVRLARFYVDCYGPQIDSVDPGFASDRLLNLENLRGLLPSVVRTDVETAQTLAIIVVRALQLASNRECLGEGIDLLDDMPAVTQARAGLLVDVATAAIDAGQFEVGRGLLDEAQAIESIVGMPAWLDSRIEQERGIVALNQGDPGRARSIALAGLEHAATSNGERYLLDLLGMATAELGSYTEAADATERALQISKDKGDLLSCAIHLGNLAEIGLRAGDTVTAAARQSESLSIAAMIGSARPLAYSVIMAAKLAGESGDWVTATRLQSAADRSIQEIGFSLYVSDRDLCDNLLATAKQVLGDDQYDSSRQAGQQLGITDAIEETRRVLESL
jgi:predicted ATPase/class 3 adenylate cyclase